jgi:hypothetical protein
MKIIAIYNSYKETINEIYSLFCERIYYENKPGPNTPK